MSSMSITEVGKVITLWRYPVKSMMGEELNATKITERGLLGDRAYAVVDGSDGKVASAKNPRKWPNLFDFRASFIQPPEIRNLQVRITLPNGAIAESQQNDINEILSTALNRKVMLNSNEHIQKGPSNAEEYWPDIEGLDYRDTVTDFALPEGTFFDCATIHLLTTASLNRLSELYPGGRLEVRRFRPNIVIETASDENTFIENSWIGHELTIGDEVRLNITGPCPRCVMTTLPQGDLPKDPGILRTAAQHNKANVGVYAAVLQGGTIHRGDRVKLD